MATLLTLTLFMAALFLIGRLGLPPNLVAGTIFVPSLLYFFSKTSDRSALNTVAFNGLLFSVGLFVAWLLWGPLVYAAAEDIVDISLTLINRL